MRRTNPKDSKLYTEWIEYAQSDLKAAQMLCKNKRTLLLSAFHSHQVIEKMLKAFMLSQKGYAPDGHNIIFLCRSAAKIEHGFVDWIDECITLNNYYVQTRYPPDFPLNIDKEKTMRLVKFAQGFYKFTFDVLSKLD